MQSIVGYTSEVTCRGDADSKSAKKKTSTNFKVAFCVSVDFPQYFAQCDDFSDLKLVTSKHGYSELAHGL